MSFFGHGGADSEAPTNGPVDQSGQANTGKALTARNPGERRLSGRYGTGNSLVAGAIPARVPFLDCGGRRGTLDGTTARPARRQMCNLLRSHLLRYASSDSGPRRVRSGLCTPLNEGCQRGAGLIPAMPMMTLEFNLAVSFFEKEKG